jgi:hypothetical protein
MRKSYTKYRIKVSGGTEVVQQAIGSVLQEEYETRAEVNELRRCMLGLFKDLTVEIMAVSRYTRVRKLV